MKLAASLARKGDEVRDLVGLAEAADGVLAHEEFLDVVADGVEQRGVDEAGSHGVHADALGRVLQRGVLRHAHDRVLGGHIGGGGGEADAAEDRRDVHDRAAAVGEDRGDLRAHVAEHGVEVDRDDLVPRFVGVLRGRGGGATDAGVVHADAERREGVRELDGRRDPRDVGGVADRGLGRAAGGADLLDDLVGVVGVEVVDDHGGAVLGQQQGGRAPDSAARSRHDRRTVRYVVLGHGWPSSRAGAVPGDLLGRSVLVLRAYPSGG
ncbi:hypothetical protein RKD05_001063 [Microbacterium sp. SLBN-111]